MSIVSSLDVWIERCVVVTNIVVGILLVVCDHDWWLHTPLFCSLGLCPPPLFHCSSVIAVWTRILRLTHHGIHDPIARSQLVRVHAILYGLWGLRKQELLDGDLDGGAGSHLWWRLVDGLMHHQPLFLELVFLIDIASSSRWTLWWIVYFLLPLFTLLPLLSQIGQPPILATSNRTLTSQRGSLLIHLILELCCIEFVQIKIKW